MRRAFSMTFAISPAPTGRRWLPWLVSAALCACSATPTSTRRPGTSGGAPVSAPRAPGSTTTPAPAAAPAPAPLTIAGADDVKDCRLVGRLGSLGPRMGETAEESFSRTRGEVLARARKDGATHLVWGEARFPSSPASSIAQAYRCGR